MNALAQYRATLLVLMLSACSTLQPPSPPETSFYLLDGKPQNETTTASRARHTNSTLIVSPPHAAPGFDTQHILYTEVPHQLEYFAYSEWGDTPARMLAPLMVAALENQAAFRAVVLTPSAATGEWRLDTEILRLQQEFGDHPSRVRLTLRAYLLDNLTRQVLAWREFDETVPSPSENAYGGVVAANQAVQIVLQQLAAFCVETVRIKTGTKKPGNLPVSEDAKLP
jgi:cholesterol transport system auxiliary component